MEVQGKRTKQKGLFSGAGVEGVGTRDREEGVPKSVAGPGPHRPWNFCPGVTRSHEEPTIRWAWVCLLV